jgi:DNA-binding IclR family transcriptional regulator
VLTCFSAARSEWGLTELADELGIYKSRTHRIVKTLSDAGFLTRDPASLKYRIGWRVLGLSAAADVDASLRAVARPCMLELQQHTKGAIHIRAIRDNANVIVDAIESPLPLRLVRPVGEASPMHFGASGKVLLAFGAPQLQEAALSAPALKRFTGRSIGDRSEYLKELQRIRRQGYAFTDEEAISGVRSVAAPVIGADGYAIVAVTSALPTAALPLRSVAKHGRLVARYAGLIAQALVKPGKT